jgi:V/A-type H+-transporting ATPase subunit G/H
MVIRLSLEAIKQISETEQSAQKCITDAQTKARDIISNAQRNAAQEYDSTLKQAAAQAAEALVSAKHRGDDMAGRQLSEYHRQCKALQMQAQNRMDKAVAIVMERVVG